MRYISLIFGLISVICALVLKNYLLGGLIGIIFGVVAILIKAKLFDDKKKNTILNMGSCAGAVSIVIAIFDFIAYFLL